MDKKIIKQALRLLDIKEKYIIIHSNLLAFYKKTYCKPDQVWDIILNNFKNKTIIMPTFTLLNNQKKKHWSYNASKSESGSLTEYFRKNISSRRTVHPIHSVAIYGPGTKKIPNHNCKSSFGPGSTWEWFAKNKDVCNLSMGIGVDGGATIFHYPEEKSIVNYRVYNSFNVKIIGKNEKVSIKKFSYFARINNKNFTGQNSWKKCENDLIKKKILKQVKVRGIIFQKMNTNKVVDFISDQLKHDSNYLGRLIKY